jgi:protein-tyrosine phosphatase
MSVRSLVAFGFTLALSLGYAGSSSLIAQPAPAGPAHTRRVPLQGAANFRDLGGYATEDGRHVKWGLVYRSNHLADLTAADYEQLSGLGIKLVCDLRTDGERKRMPTIWQGRPAPEILAASVMKDTDVVLTPERLKELAASSGSNVLGDSYSRMITEFPEQYGNVLRRLAYGPLPAVTHCTAGKDRTGVFSALLLTMLGVPRKVVIEDYMLTGTYMLEDAALRRASMDWQKMTGSSEAPPKATLQGMYTVHEEALTGTFDTITRVHGSFDAFVRDGLKLTPADIATLRTRLLE